MTRCVFGGPIQPGRRSGLGGRLRAAEPAGESLEAPAARTADMSDLFDLDRFVAAQAPVYADVLRELRDGRKQSHWMWFVFPQLRGLGRSTTAERYGITSKAEARAYLAHDVLGRRLRECTRLVLAVEGSDARQIFGSPDDLKLRSSMTLFDVVAPDDIFAEVLVRFFADGRDALTLERMAGETAEP